MPERKASSEPDATGKQPRTISEQEFRDLLSHRLKPLLALAVCFSRSGKRPIEFSRPLLATVLAETAQAEELLDAYGARNNSDWLLFREMVASAKNFSAAGYKLVHIRHAQTRYSLLSVRCDLAADIDGGLEFVGQIVQCVMGHLANAARQRKLRIPRRVPRIEDFDETLPVGVLPRNRKVRFEVSAGERIVHLATSFLDLAAGSQMLDIVRRTSPADYAGLIPDPVSEESLRKIEHGLHSLQSLYDTYISDSDTEETDSDLRTFRSHVSLTFHLLEVATDLVHFYERHIELYTSGTVGPEQCPVDFNRLLDVVVNTCLLNAGRYIGSTRKLCHTMLRRYAKISTVRAPIPRYRGFHVRPSTLVAKVVKHYGSDVTMELAGETYDAGSPLDLFRANEQVNAEKRRRLAADVAVLSRELDPTPDTPDAMRALLYRVLVRLAEMNRIVIYEHPLPMEKLQPAPGQTPMEFIHHGVNELLIMGKIDVESQITVVLKGDERVLHDLRVLAENGYCEDAFGNNTPIPPELSYLRR